VWREAGWCRVEGLAVVGVEPVATRYHVVPAADPDRAEPCNGRAARREHISNEQWKRSQAQPAPAPLTDRTATDDGFPLVLVLVGGTVPLAFLIVAIGKPALSYGLQRRHPPIVA
jgi:hypothetical protein